MSVTASPKRPCVHKNCAMHLSLVGVMVLLVGCTGPFSVPPTQLTPRSTVETQSASLSAVYVTPLSATAQTTSEVATAVVSPSSGTAVASGENVPVESKVAAVRIPTAEGVAVPTVPPPSSCVTVSGYVVDGGDTTPAGLSDAPRRFAYQVRTDAGSIVTITYRAFPPSPAGDKADPRLNFHAGAILKGDYLKACGNFDQASQTLFVVERGHYVETYPSKP